MILRLLLLAGFVSVAAYAGKRRDADPDVQSAVSLRDAKPAELARKLFPSVLPLDAGPPVPGLVHTSAQVCAACHPAVADRWAGSAHARRPSAALVEAAGGQAACLSCHLPLTSQAEGRRGKSAAAPFDATLAIEGVTCAACHVRDAAVVTGDLAAAARPSPHPLVYADALARSEGCAACHQLTWPGASEPLYDTYGEWKRSGLADLSISCLDCHLYGGADGAEGADHSLAIDPARAVTVQLLTPTLHLVRGSAPLAAKVALTNTGSGHSFPTGSPFRAVALRVTLATPGEGAASELLVADLARHIDPAPPFATRSDTRLAAGQSRAYDLSLAVPLDAPPGDWILRVRLERTVRGAQVTGPPVVDLAWPIVVE